MDREKFEHAVEAMRQWRREAEAFYGTDDNDTAAAMHIAELPDDELMRQISNRVDNARTDFRTYKAYKALAVVLLRKRRALPLDLADWIADELAGDFPKPKGRSDMVSLRNNLIGNAMHYVVEALGLTPTRDAYKKYEMNERWTACDAARKVWPGLGYDSARKIWTQFNRGKKIVDAMAEKNSSPINRMH